ncbi:hypothetical protein LR48_Vigan10g238700 [Vigna angularis]|uniref:Uncharacterized protein n=1 Tax=Phaseolus angularis TaxID=3914 RepID=A0A0L9VN75_PHAAN|nr:hypothetical protein LR48_Vigan10g238700 [Vigna angularis]
MDLVGGASPTQVISRHTIDWIIKKIKTMERFLLAAPSSLIVAAMPHRTIATAMPHRMIAAAMPPFGWEGGEDAREVMEVRVGGEDGVGLGFEVEERVNGSAGCEGLWKLL